MRREPMPLVLMALMPLVLMALFKPVFENGAAQSVPGMTVLFAFFLVGQVGYVFFREHAWGTWDRLRATDLRRHEILLGKTIVPLCTFAVQFALLFLAGWALFGLQVRGSIAGLAAVGGALALALTAFGLALVSTVPLVHEPADAREPRCARPRGRRRGAGPRRASSRTGCRPSARYTPGHWAMTGFTRAITGPASAADLLTPVAVLLGWAAAFAVIAAWRFRFEESKTGWA